jgi:hypothetical protein
LARDQALVHALPGLTAGLQRLIDAGELDATDETSEG